MIEDQAQKDVEFQYARANNAEHAAEQSREMARLAMLEAEDLRQRLEAREAELKAAETDHQRALLDARKAAEAQAFDRLGKEMKALAPQIHHHSFSDGYRRGYTNSYQASVKLVLELENFKDQYSRVYVEVPPWARLPRPAADSGGLKEAAGSDTPRRNEDPQG